MGREKFDLAEKDMVDDSELPLARKSTKKSKAKEKKPTQSDLLKEIDDEEIE